MHWYVSYRTGGSTVVHIFKKRSTPLLPRASLSIVAIAMRSKSDQCWDPWKETCSTSGTSGGSWIKTRAQRRPIQPLGRYPRQAQESDAKHLVRRGKSNLKVDRTGRLTPMVVSNPAVQNSKGDHRPQPARPRYGFRMRSHRIIWLRVRNTDGARSLGPSRIAGDPRRFGFRPQCVSARQFVLADRVL